MSAGLHIADVAGFAQPACRAMPKAGRVAERSR